MKQETIDTIIRLNNDFYKKVAKSFSNTRQYPWGGWKRVLPYIEEHRSHTILDFACGNGRFLDFLLSKGIEPKYTGVDSSSELLDIAMRNHSRFKYKFIKGDILTSRIADTEKYDMIVSFGFMHHVPTAQLRKQIISRLFSQLNKNGVLILTFWSNPTKSGVITDDKLPSNILSLKDEMEENDYFLGWDDIPNAIRYCHLFDEQEVVGMLDDYKKIELFRDDGKTSQDNIYAVLFNR